MDGSIEHQGLYFLSETLQDEEIEGTFKCVKIIEVDLIVEYEVLSQLVQVVFYLI